MNCCSFDCKEYHTVREDGYYWISWRGGAPEPARWDGHFNAWFTCGDESGNSGGYEVLGRAYPPSTKKTKRDALRGFIR